MKNTILVVFCLVLFISSFAATPLSVVKSEKDKSWPIYQDRMEGIVNACLGAINRVEMDPHFIDKSLPLCVDYFTLFFYDREVSWPSSTQVYLLSMDITELWSKSDLKIYSQALGCTGGCEIGFINQFLAGKVRKILEQEIIKQGEILREKGFVVPSYND